MARKRKQDAATEATPESTGESAKTLTAPTTEEPPFEPTGSYMPSEADFEAARQAGRFRSWLTDSKRGYRRLTDEEQQRIVLLFERKPPEDVLTAIKGADFRYQPEYHGQKNAWLRRNDHEGRLQVEAIEKLIRSTIPGLESPERQ